MNPFVPRPLGAALLAAYAGATFAADPVAPDATAVAIDSVTVTAVPLHGAEDHLARPVIVLADEELRRKLAATLGETLNRELGVSSTSFGPGASRPLIRGLGGERVRVLENGIGSMDASSLSDDHAIAVDPLVARQVEVLKGPATLLYGSGAIGGVVNVVTDRVPTALPERPRGRMQFGWDEASEAFGGGATVDAAAGPFALHIDGLKRSTSDYDIPGTASLAPVPGERRGALANSDTASSGVTGGASYVGSRGYLGFDVNHYDTEYGIPGGDGRRIALDQDRYDIGGELRDPLPGFTRLRMRMGHNDYLHQELEAGGGVGTTFLNDEYEGRVELAHAPLAELEGVVGVQVQHRNFSAVGSEQLTPPVEGRNIGVFVVEERDVGRLHVEFGARYENVDYQPAVAGQPARAFDLYSVSAGTLWHFEAGYDLGVSFTRGQRAPGIEELYNRGPHDATDSYERGDAALRQETANALDVSLHKDAGRWQWRGNVFANYMEDFVYQVHVDGNGDGLADRVDEAGNPVLPGDGFLLLDYTHHDAVLWGMEAELAREVMRDATFGELDARVFGDYVRGRLTNGQPLPRMTPLRFGGGLDYRWRQWSAEFTARRTVAQHDNAPLETETGGYTQVDLGVHWTLEDAGHQYVVSARGTNLLDEAIRYHTSLLKAFAPQPGRSVMLTVETNFE